jgi:hypothetical protein
MEQPATESEIVAALISDIAMSYLSASPAKSWFVCFWSFWTSIVTENPYPSSLLNSREQPN